MASYDIAPDKLPTPVSMAFKNAKSNSALVRNYAELALIDLTERTKPKAFLSLDAIDFSIYRLRG